MDFSELNSVESAESMEIVEDYFQSLSYSKLLKNSIQLNLQNLQKTIFSHFHF